MVENGILGSLQLFENIGNGFNNRGDARRNAAVQDGRGYGGHTRVAETGYGADANHGAETRRVADTRRVSNTSRAADEDISPSRVADTNRAGIGRTADTSRVTDTRRVNDTVRVADTSDPVQQRQRLDNLAKTNLSPSDYNQFTENMRSIDAKGVAGKLPAAEVWVVGHGDHGLTYDPGHMELVTDERSRPVWAAVARWILSHGGIRAVR
jgi:hypothetical protein